MALGDRAGAAPGTFPAMPSRVLILGATSAIASIESGVNSSVTPSVAISATYCLISEASVSVRMRRKSSRVSAESSTRIGKRPCSSGKRSEGFER